MTASNTEITRRITVIREGMKDAGLDGLIVFSQILLGEKAAIRYISNYRLLTRKAYIVLPLAGEPMLALPTSGQQGAARKVSWIKDVRCGAETTGVVREVADKLKSSGLAGGKIGIVGLSTSLPAYDYELLRGELPEARFTDANGLLDFVRMAKSAEEIEMTRATTEIADRAYEKVLETIRPGVNEWQVMGEVHKLLILEGVEDNLILSARGRSFPGFITPPEPYVFAEGDHYTFSIEIAGPSGYWSQVVRPMCLGKPSESYVCIFEVGSRALRAGAALLKPGVSAGAVARAIVASVKGEGFQTGLWCGHAMGMDLGDGLGLFEDNETLLRDGAVITLHPHIMSPDGKEGLLMGDTYVVREKGGENLSRTLCELKSLRV